MTIFNSSRFLAGVSACVMALSANAAFGQEKQVPEAKPVAEEKGIADIVVTAERRSASLQRTPIAITALAGDTLQKQQITGLQSLAVSTPNVNFSRNGGDARVFIRGIGVDSTAPGADPRVAIYTDGVYNARVQAAFGSFYDIERVEILAGPQGTLYGRNATAGAINIISRDPGTTLNGYASLVAGNYGLIQTEGAVGGPISSTVSARLAFQTIDHGGYGENINTHGSIDDQKTRAVRGKLVFEPSTDFKLKLQGDYFKEDDHQGGYHFFGNSPGNQATSLSLGFVAATNPRDTAGHGPLLQIESYGLSAIADWKIGSVKLTSVSAYRHLDAFNYSDPDATTGGFIPLISRERSNQVSEELRGATTVGPLDILVGGYYFHEKNYAANAAHISAALLGGPATVFLHGTENAGTQKTDAFAAFSQVTLHIAPGLGLDAGLRYSSEKRSVSQYAVFDAVNVVDSFNVPSNTGGPAPFLNSDKISESSVDPKFTLHYQFTPNLFSYVTYSQGFKSGGFNVAFIQQNVKAEKLKDYEAGIKADLFDRRVRANISGFLYKYSNLQVNITEGISLITQNAAAAKLYGIEAQVTLAPTDSFRLSLNGAWVHSEYTDYITADPARPALGVLNLSGNPLTYAPKYKLQGQAEYTLDTGIGKLTPRVNVTWVDRVYFTPFKQSYASQAPWTNVDLFLDLDLGKGLSASAFVRNATNHFYKVSSTINTLLDGGGVVGLVGAPRTFGGSITKRF